MKNKMVIAGVAMGLFLIGCGIVGNTDYVADYCDYTMETTVVTVESDYITVEDTTGNLWDLDTSEYTNGDKIRLYMDNNGTDSIYDDTILDSSKIR